MIRLMTSAACLLWSTLSAQGQSISAANPDLVMAQMQTAGYVVERGVDDLGDPLIASKVSRSPFSVLFYGCVSGQDCTSIQFALGYDLETPLTAARVNDWNRQNRFGRVFIDDEGDPFLRMDAVMAVDGMGPVSFALQLDFWRLLVEEFESFVEE